MTCQERLDVLDAQSLIAWPKRGRVPRFKRYLSAMGGIAVQDVITDIVPVQAHGKERVGYPTQKPLALLDRIIAASSNAGDVVLDPFAGCATACVSAESLHREWVGIDISPKAAELVRQRMRDELECSTKALTEPTYLGEQTSESCRDTTAHRIGQGCMGSRAATAPDARPTSRRVILTWTTSSPRPKVGPITSRIFNFCAARATASKATEAWITCDLSLQYRRKP